MVHVTSAPATERESAPVRPSMPRQASREQVSSSRRTMGLEQPAPSGSSEGAAELSALVHFVNELLSHGEAGGEDGGAGGWEPSPPTRGWALPLLPRPRSPTEGGEDETRHLFTAVRDGSLLRRLLSRARVEIARHSRGLHGSTGMESSEMMVIREDDEESSPERAASPG